jgi:hypothetical protein
MAMIQVQILLEHKKVIHRNSRDVARFVLMFYQDR